LGSCSPRACAQSSRLQECERNSLKIYTCIHKLSNGHRSGGLPVVSVTSASIATVDEDQCHSQRRVFAPTLIITSRSASAHYMALAREYLTC
jgi:hypothetical protein